MCPYFSLLKQASNLGNAHHGWCDTKSLSIVTLYMLYVVGSSLFYGGNQLLYGQCTHDPSYHHMYQGCVIDWLCAVVGVVTSSKVFVPINKNLHSQTYQPP